MLRSSQKFNKTTKFCDTKRLLWVFLWYLANLWTYNCEYAQCYLFYSDLRYNEEIMRNVIKFNLLLINI